MIVNLTYDMAHRSDFIGSRLAVPHQPGKEKQSPRVSERSNNAYIIPFQVVRSAFGLSPSTVLRITISRMFHLGTDIPTILTKVEPSADKSAETACQSVQQIALVKKQTFIVIQPSYKSNWRLPGDDRSIFGPLYYVHDFFLN
jgi:hypothetical protein